MDKHNIGKVHQNKLKIQETLNDIEIKSQVPSNEQHKIKN
jgi:hypothetical protein